MAEKHSRITLQGRFYWWTQRLWELSQDLPIITFEQNCWFFTLEEATCKAVAAHAQRIIRADLSYPIILSAQGFLMDGGHRLSKAWLNGMTQINAVRFEIDPEPDWIEALED